MIWCNRIATLFLPRQIGGHIFYIVLIDTKTRYIDDIDVDIQIDADAHVDIQIDVTTAGSSSCNSFVHFLVQQREPSSQMLNEGH